MTDLISLLNDIDLRRYDSYMQVKIDSLGISNELLTETEILQVIEILQDLQTDCISIYQMVKKK